MEYSEKPEKKKKDSHLMSSDDYKNLKTNIKDFAKALKKRKKKSKY